MTKVKPYKDCIILYQKNDEGIPEKTLIITKYLGDIIGIRQEENEVLINSESIKDLISVIKEVKEL